MKKILLLIALVNIVLVSRTQVVFNEVYPSPSVNNEEFFELYNTSTSSTPMSMDNFTIVTYYKVGGNTGFYVMDLPNLTIAPHGYFVGAASNPYSYQNVTNSTAADFSWNDPALAANNGYVKMWQLQSGSSADGNPNYNQGTIPSNFNDFFVPHNGSGATYTIFLYQNGVLINALIFGTGGYSTVIPEIIAMPPLFVDMSGSAPDFWIDFSTYGSVPVEKVEQNTGTDNGYIRTADGVCAAWDKSSNTVSYSPQLTNGPADAYSGVISVSAIVQKGTALTGSKLIYNVISAPSTSFPVQMDVYNDNGPSLLKLDAGDIYVESNTEKVVTDGPFTTVFFPYDANMLIVVKSSAGCIDKILFAPNMSILPVTLLYFQGNLHNNTVTLQWQVSQNESCGRFEIERSQDGKNFVTAAVVTSTGKNGLENYSYAEAAAGDKIYYRLKMYDKSESAQYSRTLAFQSNTGVKSNALRIINNPATDKLTMRFSSTNDQSVQIKVYDLSGRLQMNQKMNVYQGDNILTLPLSSSFTSGTYAVEVNNGSERQVTRFVKQ